MAGDFVPESELNLKGIHKYYNSYTLRGRFNWVVTTYGTILGMIVLYQLLKPAKSAPKPVSSKGTLGEKPTSGTNVVSPPPPSGVKSPPPPSGVKSPKDCP